MADNIIDPDLASGHQSLSHRHDVACVVFTMFLIGFAQSYHDRIMQILDWEIGLIDLSF